MSDTTDSTPPKSRLILSPIWSARTDELMPDDESHFVVDGEVVARLVGFTLPAAFDSWVGGLSERKDDE